MIWLFLATGFTGSLPLFCWLRRVHHGLVTPPSIEVYFSPKGGCLKAVTDELHRARHEVLVQAYSFTADAIAVALAEAKKRGADVVVVLDRSNEQEAYSDLHL